MFLNSKDNDFPYLTALGQTFPLQDPWNGTLDHLPNGTVTSTNNTVSWLHFCTGHCARYFHYFLWASPHSDSASTLPYSHFLDEETILGTLGNLVQVTWTITEMVLKLRSVWFESPTPANPASICSCNKYELSDFCKQ